jgi:hypothetical protein
MIITLYVTNVYSFDAAWIGLAHRFSLDFWGNQTDNYIVSKTWIDLLPVGHAERPLAGFCFLRELARGAIYAH